MLEEFRTTWFSNFCLFDWDSCWCSTCIKRTLLQPRKQLPTCQPQLFFSKWTRSRSLIVGRHHVAGKGFAFFFSHSSLSASPVHWGCLQPWFVALFVHRFTERQIVLMNASCKTTHCNGIRVHVLWATRSFPIAKMQGSRGDTAFTFEGNTAAAAEGGMQSSPGTGTGESEARSGLSQ